MSAEPSREPAAVAPAAAQPSTDGGLTLATASVAVLGLVFSLVALVAFGGRSALGVAIGAAIGLANLVVFVRVVRGVLGGGARGRLWILVAILKIFALFGGLWLLMRSGVASVLSLLLGYGALPLGIALGGLIAPKPTDPPEARAATEPGPDEPAGRDEPGPGAK